VLSSRPPERFGTLKQDATIINPPPETVCPRKTGRTLGKMRQVSYAGGRFVTTDEVADALLHLVVGIAATGVPQRVEVPIVVEGDGGGQETAWMTVGPSPAMLSVPLAWVGEVPDFSDQVTMMRMQASYPRTATTIAPSSPETWDPAPVTSWDDEDYYGL